MKYVEEYRDGKACLETAEAIRKMTTKPWVIMEICGGQTHSIAKYGIEDLLPKQVSLVHGPGCPVCVTPVEIIDKAVAIAAMPDVIFCSFGDMMRVPGTQKDLLSVKAEGGQVRLVYSPLDAVKIARQNPTKQVVFFAVGFETTAPANAMAVVQAKALGLTNFSILVSHVLVPPAMEAILSSSQNRVQGFLAAGHVCTIMGYEEYLPLAEKYKIPIVVTGFEPLDILHGIYLCVKQLEEGLHSVENQYARAVLKQGNIEALKVIREVFTVVPRKWRGIGEIPKSGWALNKDYSSFDAERRFQVAHIKAEESTECIAGQILLGLKKPMDCPAFGAKCTPEHPLGAPMVSTEGACSAYYRYRRAESTVTMEK
jgi:hydrogenase expression/formation protein HypD